MSSVVLETPPPPACVKEEQHTSFTLSYREVKCGYRPTQSFGLSIIFHQLGLLAILFLPAHLAFMRVPPATNSVLVAERQATTLYLPTLGGGSEGSGGVGGGSGQQGNVSSGLRARSHRGFAYPGPQPMVSNPPGATIGIQTILQPSLENLPLLKRYLPLPNIVKPAEAADPEPAKTVLSVKAGRLAIHPAADRPIDAPKITLPAGVTSIPNLATSSPVLPQKSETKPSAPDPPEVSEVLTTGLRAEKGLLVMNAVPPPPDLSAPIPRAQARGLFAVSPAEATVIADPAAGAKAGESTSSDAGSGNPSDISKGDALAETASGGSGGDHTPAASGNGSGGHYGTGHGSGLNGASGGSGGGRGELSGSGVGTGSGTSLGSGTGAGRAPGAGGFPGMTIQGGRYGNSDTGNLHPSLAPRGQTSYGMTIVSTASSGGGLPDIGVFQNEKVYTVYLDMRANDEDNAPSWTLQYAVLQPQSIVPGTNGHSGRIQRVPTPPYAMLKEIPEFTPELRRKYAHRVIVASAIMNTEGKLEQVSIPQSSDNELAGPLAAALGNWMFQPAQVDGQPVSLKVLLGIRFSVPR
jgi:hypothetical protein